MRKEEVPLQQVGFKKSSGYISKDSTEIKTQED